MQGWQTCGPADEILMVAVHRARHVFANDARDLVDLAVAVEELDDPAWEALLDDAEASGLTGALYASLRQMAWWLAGPEDAVTGRVEELRRSLPGARTRQLDGMAGPELVLTRASPLATPLGRHGRVFPATIGGYWRSLAAALVFLPARLVEGRDAREVK